MTPLVRAENITDYIPQQYPFVMVGTLNSRDDKGAISSFFIDEENILVEDGRFTVSGLLENIAQTAAANVGYACAEKEIPVPMGIIGAISKVKVYDLPKVASEIKTKIEIKHEIFNITLIEGTVELEGKMLITCQMKIMVEIEESK